MKNISIYVVTLILTAFSVSCTKFDIIDTGVADGNHDMVMWDYFKTNPYDWDSVMVMINHAGLKNVFDGTSEHGKEITFLGITNHSIRRYLLDKDIPTVKDMPVEECRDIVLSCVIKGRFLLDDFIEGAPSKDPEELIGTGGKMYTTLSGKEIWIYTIRDPFGGVPKSGPKTIQIVAPETQKRFRVVSTNIQTTSGVIHALDYNGFTIKDI
ncbi:fasciclin [Porphyromonas sp.]|uniref:fasciclin n=1 Tax=Porphyromonas sp. TaxID=1924944 RepID=UPI0026DD9A61|nr:fasciclin [Porphyromonas sp.]MDO4771515.1 fasciclin [Porphyromonas sp.]